MKQRTVLSLEQALSMPYATLRFAQLGWSFACENISRLGFGEHETPELLDDIATSEGEQGK